MNRCVPVVAVAALRRATGRRRATLLRQWTWGAVAVTVGIWVERPPRVNVRAARLIREIVGAVIKKLKPGAAGPANIWRRYLVEYNDAAAHQHNHILEAVVVNVLDDERGDGFARGNCDLDPAEIATSKPRDSASGGVRRNNINPAVAVNIARRKQWGA